MKTRNVEILVAQCEINIRLSPTFNVFVFQPLPNIACMENKDTFKIFSKNTYSIILFFSDTRTGN